MLPPAQPRKGVPVQPLATRLLQQGILGGWATGLAASLSSCLYPPHHACQGFSSMILVGLTSRRLHM